MVGFLGLVFWCPLHVFWKSCLIGGGRSKISSSYFSCRCQLPYGGDLAGVSNAAWVVRAFSHLMRSVAIEIVGCGMVRCRQYSTVPHFMTTAELLSISHFFAYSGS